MMDRDNGDQLLGRMLFSGSKKKRRRRKKERKKEVKLVV